MIAEQVEVTDKIFPKVRGYNPRALSTVCFRRSNAISILLLSLLLKRAYPDSDGQTMQWLRKPMVRGLVCERPAVAKLIRLNSFILGTCLFNAVRDRILKVPIFQRVVVGVRR